LAGAPHSSSVKTWTRILKPTESIKPSSPQTIRSPKVPWPPCPSGRPSAPRERVRLCLIPSRKTHRANPSGPGHRPCDQTAQEMAAETIVVEWPRFFFAFSSLPLPITGLLHYCELVRPCAPHRYSHPCGSSTWVSALSSGRQVPRVPLSALLFSPWHFFHP
jgi:hypothetical protein